MASPNSLFPYDRRLLSARKHLNFEHLFPLASDGKIQELLSVHNIPISELGAFKDAAIASELPPATPTAERKMLSQVIRAATELSKLIEMQPALEAIYRHESDRKRAEKHFDRLLVDLAALQEFATRARSQLTGLRARKSNTQNELIRCLQEFLHRQGKPIGAEWAEKKSIGTSRFVIDAVQLLKNKTVLPDAVGWVFEENQTSIKVRDNALATRQREIDESRDELAEFHGE